MVLIPERFGRRVIEHVLSVCVWDDSPMLLIVQGKPGDGKSFQLRVTLESEGFVPFVLSSSLLGARMEGGSVRRVQELYKEAAEYFAKEGRLPALVLEDFDLSPANIREDTKYTVNTQLLTGFLMNLAEDVGSAEVDTSQRFPIFLTGNNLSGLYGPLVRPGRTEFFTWEPTREEKELMITSAISSIVPDVQDARVQQFARKHSDVSIAHIGAAVNYCRGQALYRHYQQSKGYVSIADLRRSHGKLTVDLQSVESRLAEMRGAGSRVGNFLRS